MRPTADAEGAAPIGGGRRDEHELVGEPGGDDDEGGAPGRLRSPADAEVDGADEAGAIPGSGANRPPSRGWPAMQQEATRATSVPAATSDGHGAGPAQVAELGVDARPKKVSSGRTSQPVSRSRTTDANMSAESPVSLRQAGDPAARRRRSCVGSTLETNWPAK